MAKSARRKMVDYRKSKRPQVPDWDDPELLRRLKKEADLLRDHPSTKQGDEFVEAALRDLAVELDELENRRG